MPGRRDLSPEARQFWHELREANPNHTVLELAVVMQQQFPDEFDPASKPQSIYAHICRTIDRPAKGGQIILPTASNPDTPPVDERAHYDDIRPGHLYRDAQVNVAEIPRSYTYVWDLETTDLNTFMGRTLMCSMLDLSDISIQTRTLFSYLDGPSTQENLDRAERELLDWILDRHDEADALIGHNTVGFDLGFLRGRLAALQMERTVPKRQQWDTMQIAKFGMRGRTQGSSMENLADFFRLPVQKDKPSKWDWAGSREVHLAAIERLIFRCEEDVRVNALLWAKLRPYFHQWRGRG